MKLNLPSEDTLLSLSAIGSGALAAQVRGHRRCDALSRTMCAARAVAAKRACAPRSATTTPLARFAATRARIAPVFRTGLR
jgi:hypothetical protein